MDSRSPTCCPSRPCSRSRADASQRHRARASPRPRAGPWRVPDGGRLPHAVIDDEGTTHLVYLKGEPVEGDLMYVTRGPGATTWSEPAQVNSEPGTVTGIGPIDGGHLAQGRDTCHMPGARDQKSWDAGLGGTKRDGCGTNPGVCRVFSWRRRPTGAQDFWLAFSPHSAIFEGGWTGFDPLENRV